MWDTLSGVSHVPAAGCLLSPLLTLLLVLSVAALPVWGVTKRAALAAWSLESATPVLQHGAPLIRCDRSQRAERPLEAPSSPEAPCQQNGHSTGRGGAAAAAPYPASLGHASVVLLGQLGPDLTARAQSNQSQRAERHRHRGAVPTEWSFDWQRRRGRRNTVPGVPRACLSRTPRPAGP